MHIMFCVDGVSSDTSQNYFWADTYGIQLPVSKIKSISSRLWFTCSSNLKACARCSLGRQDHGDTLGLRALPLKVNSRMGIMGLWLYGPSGMADLVSPKQKEFKFISWKLYRKILATQLIKCQIIRIYLSNVILKLFFLAIICLRLLYILSVFWSA